MINNKLTSSQLLGGLVPAVIGMGFAWLGVSVVRNESKLLLRQIELKDALSAKSSKLRRKLLYGK